MRLGFVLDQTKCIGCHACTVACKQENNVPLGVFRTWVKHIELGSFPESRRHFAVLRCNQCDDAPCVTICPTRALFRRPDGIVDFDSDACIGCKSCMQACPYDALYIDPDTRTAAKCHFCSHRVDQGLQPACQIVCPTQAILSGDLDDPTSDIAQVVRSQATQVRKPDQETKPKVHYIGAEATLLDPRLERDVAPMFTDPGALKEQPQDLGATREVYDVAHPAPWGWKVWLYLWTKSIAAGAVMLGGMIERRLDQPVLGFWPPLIGLVFIAITCALLVFDLKRPERFWYMLVRPNVRSWLVLGAYLLGLFGLVCVGWLYAERSGIALSKPLFRGASFVGWAAAVYSAFLFRQAKGRDFWESSPLFLHLGFEAALCGAAAFLVVGVGPAAALEKTLAAATLLSFATIAYDLFWHPGNKDARTAARAISRGELSTSFWTVVVALGTALPLALLGARWLGGPRELSTVASILALAGALEYGRLWIRAGQSVRLS